MTIETKNGVELPFRYSKLPVIGQPSHTQVREMRKKFGLTIAQAAALLYIDVDTWRQYEKPREQRNARHMRAALWELFLIKVGELSPNLYLPPSLPFGRAAPPAEKPAALFRRAES